MQLNLNLLTALDALLEEGSVIGAADRLHLSQPAMSRALGRLRQVTGDQVLVRSGRTMSATPWALAVHERVHALLQTATEVLCPQPALDLEALDRTFTIRGHDMLIGIVATRLVSVIQQAAPGVRLCFLAEAATDTQELQRGQVDLELTGTTPANADIRFETLGAGHLVVALRPNNPLSSGELTAARYAAARHIVVSRRGRLRDQMDAALAAIDLGRKVIAAAPTTVDALRIVQQSDAITTIPLEATRALVGDLGLLTRDLPLEVAPVLAMSSWHQRYETDPAHQWLRSEVRQAFAAAYETAAHE